MMDLNRLRKLALRAAITATLGLAASSAYAQNAPAKPAEPDDNIDEVVVTGTRVAARTRSFSSAYSGVWRRR